MKKAPTIPAFVRGAELAARLLRDELRSRLFDEPETWAETYPGTYHNWVRTQMRLDPVVPRAEMAIGFDLFYSDPARNRWYLELTERSLHPRNSISVRGRSRIESLVRHIDVTEVVDFRLRFIQDSDPRKGKVEWLIESSVLDQQAITAEYVANLTRVLFPFFARKLNATAYK